VFSGLAGLKLSGSPKLYGKSKDPVMNAVMTKIAPSRSFDV